MGLWKSIVHFSLLLILVPILSFNQIYSSWAQESSVTKIINIRLGAHMDKTRLVLDLTRETQFRAFYLADPYRLVLDLPKIDFEVKASGLKKAVGGVSGYRFGLFDNDTSRIVIDLVSPMIIKKSFHLRSNVKGLTRLVIDLKTTSRSKFQKEATNTIKNTRQKLSSSASLKKKASSLSPSMKIGNQKLIIIDPGHGGVDPGAIGHAGTYEKHVVLSAAKVFKQIIEKDPAYRVILTRTKDQFLTLRNRISRSKLSGADLFISIHADSIANNSVRGATIYTLSETASDKEAAQLAERENKADIISGVDLSDETEEVTNILIDLAQRETMNQAAKFAGILVPELLKVIKTHKRPHKFAGFAVLKAPDVPSILLEMGYLSNVNDERLLKQDSFVRKIAKSVKIGLDKYFASVP
tara:strand:- start:508 stop:1740 length:1233 start_codon:yes stop_codon:yes gene_type:complete